MNLSRFDAVARDPRVASVRVATVEEAEGEPAVIVVLAEGVVLDIDGCSSFLAYSPSDARRLLRRCVYKED